MHVQIMSQLFVGLLTSWRHSDVIRRRITQEWFGGRGLWTFKLKSYVIVNVFDPFWYETNNLIEQSTDPTPATRKRREAEKKKEEEEKKKAPAKKPEEEKRKPG